MRRPLGYAFPSLFLCGALVFGTAWAGCGSSSDTDSGDATDRDGAGVDGAGSGGITTTDCASLLASYEEAAQADPEELTDPTERAVGDACLTTAGVPRR